MGKKRHLTPYRSYTLAGLNVACEPVSSADRRCIDLRAAARRLLYA
jgi:hypothetical protein